MNDKLFKLKMNELVSMKFICEQSEYFSAIQEESNVIVNISQDHEVVIRYHGLMFENINKLIITDDISSIVDNDGKTIAEIDSEIYILNMRHSDTKTNVIDGEEHHTIILDLEEYKIPRYIFEYSECIINREDAIQMPQVYIDIDYDGYKKNYIGTLYIRTSIDDLIPLKVSTYISEDLRHLLSELNCIIYKINQSNAKILGNIGYVLLRQDNNVEIYNAMKSSDILMMQNVITGNVSRITYDKLLIPDDSILGKLFILPKTSIIVCINQEYLDDMESDRYNENNAFQIIYNTDMINPSDVDDLRNKIFSLCILWYKNINNIDNILDDDKKNMKELSDYIKFIRNKDTNYFEDIIITYDDVLYNLTTSVDNII